MSIDTVSISLGLVWIRMRLDMKGNEVNFIYNCWADSTSGLKPFFARRLDRVPVCVRPTHSSNGLVC